MSKAPDKSHRTINPPFKKSYRLKTPRNKMPPIQKVPRYNLPPVKKCPLLHIGGVSMPVATTYTRTHKLSKDVTRRIKPNPSATRGFYLINT